MVRQVADLRFGILFSADSGKGSSTPDVNYNWHGF